MDRGWMVIGRPGLRVPSCVAAAIGKLAEGVSTAGIRVEAAD